MGKRYLLTSAAAVLLLFGMAAVATAQTWTAESVTVTLADDGTMTVRGRGPMPNYNSTGGAPWNKSKAQVTKVVIEDGVTSIGGGAFSNFTKMASVVIPKSVTSIGWAAFWGCRGLKEIEIGRGVETIANKAFNGCTGLASVTIPKSVTSVHDDAFPSSIKLINENGVQIRHLVRFDANGSRIAPDSAFTAVVGSRRKKQGTLGVLPMPEMMTDYNFDGWFTTKNGGERVTRDTRFTADATIYARWSKRSFISVKDAPETQAAARSYIPGTYLVKSKWNQGNPYNALLPIDPVAGNKRVVTGCSNTGTSQIMNYHKWPAKLSGVIPGYTTESRKIVMPAIEAENFRYDWANMRNRYGNYGTQAQKDAVATLMLHVGTAMKTNYANDGSSAGMSVSVMQELFDYDGGMRNIRRKGEYSRPEGTAKDSILPYIWDDVMRLQIDNMLPVYYSGKRDGGGHIFILDGYDNNGNFHVNWGWGGSKDGWFTTTNFKPSNERYYNSNHSTIINVMPNQNRKGTSDLRIFGRNLRASKLSVNHNEVFTVNPTIYNIGTATSPRGKSLGIALCRSDSQCMIIGETMLNRTLTFTRAREMGSYTNAQLRQDFSLEVRSVVPDGVPVGQYVLRAVMKNDNNEWEVMRTAKDYLNLAAISIGGAPPPPVRTITFNANGGKISVPSPKATPVTPQVDLVETMSVKTAAGGWVAPLPLATRDGHDFAGWFTAPAGGERITVNTVFSANAAVYAQWTAPVYTITFNAGNGNVSPAFGLTGANGTLAAMPVPAREGYTFSGWFTDRRGGKAITKDTKFDKHSDIFAQWVINTGASAGKVEEETPVEDEAIYDSPVVEEAIVPSYDPEEEYAEEKNTEDNVKEEAAAPAQPDPQPAAVVPPPVADGAIAVDLKDGKVEFELGGINVRVGTLIVYDAEGKPVKRLPVSGRSASWDLTDTRGRQVPAGVYVIEGEVTTYGNRRHKASLTIDVR